MSREKGPSWQQLLVSAILSGAAVAAARYDVDKLIDNRNDGASSNGNASAEPALKQESTPQIVLKLPLDEKPLSAEILKKIRQNLVTITRYTRTQYEEHIASGTTCSGFLTRSSTNYPFVVTASHCIPSKIVSDADGKTYDSEDENGYSIFYIDITDVNDNIYRAREWFSYNDPSLISNDILKIRLENESEITVHQIALNISEPNQWETYYIVRKSSDNKVSANPIRFLDSPIEDEYRFINIGSADNACFPGVSGSLIVNSAGEIVSIVTNSDTYTIKKSDAQMLNLDPIHIGRIVNMCLGPSSRQIQNLRSE